MAGTQVNFDRRRYVVVPLVALLALIVAWGRDPGGITGVVLTGLLAAAVLTAVHHAEVIALRVGEPFGSLVLAVAVTVIEVGLILALMLSEPEKNTSLARDTVFAAVMITTNGMVGLALVVATLRHRVTVFRSEGVSGAFATIGALAVLSMVLPRYTTSTPGPTFTTAQLVYAGLASLGLYLLFVFVQTVRHRDYFLPVDDDPDAPDPEDVHADPPTNRQALTSLALLVVSLVAVVGLAKTISPLIEGAVADAGLPRFVVAVAIALLVLLPESIAATKAAARGRIQTSFNLAYGSALASIGLTVPAIGLLSIFFDFNVLLGLAEVEIALLFVTLFIGTLTLTQGRATLLQGGLHLAVFAGFLTLAFSP